MTTMRKKKREKQLRELSTHVICYDCVNMWWKKRRKLGDRGIESEIDREQETGANVPLQANPQHEVKSLY